MKKILVINGPNLNLLGTREPEIYGSETLKDIENRMRNYAGKFNVEVDFFQSNHEGEIVDSIQAARDKYGFIIINAAAYTHTSVAIRDALSAVEIPSIEVHISNIYKREHFRHKSYLSPVVTGEVMGLGIESYMAALFAALIKMGVEIE
ncbi:MAG: type II 3-dehydroquinate dehydratase [Selenomonadaceae bacterium]|nr:type II 3-dehydroquinate dehydratase [Selenomonadaceae bacterium]